MKKNWSFMLMGCLLLGSLLQAQGTSVGGHLVLTMYDRPSGEHNGEKTSNYIGFSFRRVFLYFSAQLSDNISVDVQPEWSASTRATPSFGSDIARKRHPDDVEPGFHGFVKAVVTAVLPKDYELSFGIVKPLFSWDYGHELFWEEEFNGSKWACFDGLGSVHDAGFELYKNFELGNASVPTYFYVLNGGEPNLDNNKTPAIMGTVEPEFGALKFKVSFLTGRWNDAWDDEGNWDGTEGKNYMKYLFGGWYENGPFAVRSEYAASNFKEQLDDGSDAKTNGYYAKVFYRFASWGRFMIHYDYRNQKYSGSYASYEKYTTITPGLIINASESAKIMISYDIADWERNRAGIKDTIKFNRLLAGWRITF